MRKMEHAESKHSTPRGLLTVVEELFIAMENDDRVALALKLTLSNLLAMKPNRYQSIRKFAHGARRRAQEEVLEKEGEQEWT